MPAAEIDVARAEPEADPQPSSIKRKANVEEIEVDLQAPEPPSKKARRALKKGKTPTAKPSSDHDHDDDILEDGDAAASSGNNKDRKDKPRSEHGVWIGNLPFRLTALELRKWLVDNTGGVISETCITRVKLPTVKDAGARRDRNDKDKERPANKGFAYVDFSDLATKVAAIALSESDLQGRKLLIKDAKSFEGRPAKEAAKAEQDEGEAGADGKDGAAGVGGHRTTQQRQESNASRKVFVGNLSFKTTQEDLERNFERCGEIEWAKLATFEDTGKCKGFGWVKFKEPEAAAWAVRGFVKVKEKVDTVEDFEDGSDEDEDGGEKSGEEEEEEEEEDGEDKEKKKKGNGKTKKGAQQQQQQQKQFKTRKWWVNRLLGRELKLELAEDDQLRYKKRFGKDAKRAAADGAEAKPRERAANNDRNNDRSSSSSSNRQNDGQKEKNTGGKDTEDRRNGKVAMKASSQDISVARLTGAVVQHTGTKVTFD